MTTLILLLLLLYHGPCLTLCFYTHIFIYYLFITMACVRRKSDWFIVRDCRPRSVSRYRRRRCVVDRDDGACLHESY